jgi:hypothetical protein
MDVRKLRSAFLRFHYSLLRLIAAIEDVLETYQEMGGLIGRLTAAGVLKNSPMKGVVAFLQDTHSVFTCGLAGDQRMRSSLSHGL